MNQKKTGTFLKHLRKEKGLTQEQLAEQFYVSSRTVSRWETGSNMPDLEILIELADFYHVDIREIIDGERKSEIMDNETKDTLKKVAEYTEEQNKKLKKKMIDMMAGSAILIVFCSILFETNAFNGSIPENSYHNIMAFTLGLALGALVLNILYLCGFLDKAREYKLKIFRKNK
jgi:transcriptional regulator with XRE-family HTH domain